MGLKLQTEQCLEILSVQGRCTGSSESTLVKMPHCWKSHVAAQFGLCLQLKLTADPESSERGGGVLAIFILVTLVASRLWSVQKKTIATCDFPVGWGSGTPDPPMLSRLYIVH